MPGRRLQTLPATVLYNIFDATEHADWLNILDTPSRVSEHLKEYLLESERARDILIHAARAKRDFAVLAVLAAIMDVRHLHPLYTVPVSGSSKSLNGASYLSQKFSALKLAARRGFKDSGIKLLEIGDRSVSNCASRPLSRSTRLIGRLRDNWNEKHSAFYAIPEIMLHPKMTEIFALLKRENASNSVFYTILFRCSNPYIVEPIIGKDYAAVIVRWSLYVIIEYGLEECANLMLKHGAVVEGPSEFILDKGKLYFKDTEDTDPSWPDIYIVVAVLHMARTGSRHMVAWCLRNGADINSVMAGIFFGKPYEFPETPTTVYILGKFEWKPAREGARYLLSLGADLSVSELQPYDTNDRMIYAYRSRTMKTRSVIAMVLIQWGPRSILDPEFIAWVEELFDQGAGHIEADRFLLRYSENYTFDRAQRGCKREHNYPLSLASLPKYWPALEPLIDHLLLDRYAHDGDLYDTGTLLHLAVGADVDTHIQAINESNKSQQDKQRLLRSLLGYMEFTLRNRMDRAVHSIFESQFSRSDINEYDSNWGTLLYRCCRHFCSVCTLDRYFECSCVMDSYRWHICSLLQAMVAAGADPYRKHDGKTVIDLLNDASSEADPQFKAYFSELGESLKKHRNEFLTGNP